MKAEIRTITPEYAQELLALNVSNRPLNHRFIDQLADEIQQGRWKLNGATITLNGDRLIDGQHRLHAIVRAGVKVQSFVIEGLPSDVFDTVDLGRKRTGGDLFAIRGETNTNTLAAALKIIFRADAGQDLSTRQYVSPADLVATLNRYPGLRDSVHRFNHGATLASASMLAALHQLFAAKHSALADKFLDDVVNGSGLSADDPAYLLRSRLIANKGAKAKLPTRELFALFIKAWNAAREGQKRSNLRWRNDGPKAEPFPTIL